jgi:hypothetical protein
VRELVIALTTRFPALGHRLDDLAVVRSTVIYNSAPYQKIGEDSEIYFVPCVPRGSIITSSFCFAVRHLAGGS